MNANELADELEYACTIVELRITMMERMKHAATMLREQQAQIEALKANFNKEKPVKEVFNKPVAYRWKSDLGYIYDIYDHGGGEPLYTHPAELTDEEIDEISKEVWERPWLEVHRKFAKAILRKAQEK